jgi:hypothetical protein
MGTRIGFGFIERCLKLSDYEVKPTKPLPFGWDNYYQPGLKDIFDASGWQNLNATHRVPYTNVRAVGPMILSKLRIGPLKEFKAAVKGAFSYSAGKIERRYRRFHQRLGVFKYEPIPIERIIGELNGDKKVRTHKEERTSTEGL